ncbi:MAG: oxygen-dependent coproporphyrinogen oxidase [Anaeromyxobacter sp.]
MPTPAPQERLDQLRLAMGQAARALQAELCAALERLDGLGRFRSDAWERPGGGGGLSRVLEEGAVLEKAGVNVSEVWGEVPPALASRVQGAGGTFAAVGLSAVIHPQSPLVPTAHANIRFLHRGGAGWFGGGADLTPHYLFEEDARHFHAVLRDACEQHEAGSYVRHKRTADDYFYLRHRGERRGVGGIFFEDLGGDLERELAFAQAVGRAFLAAYLPIVERRKDLPWGEAERRWQEVRRGRYVEFNLLFDRGTTFGLETGGRTESILMSLPPRVRWAYDHHPSPGSREAALVEVLRTPREWA